ncbi:FBD-associated F-box protein At4g10400-like [Trifolium pratense]|uniref:FBD-associated F-box protein At4g10400-like n=1 Tax=Trifolium pratense TaxID=57577 RepID=UPI001E6964E4|nr:FBD-associated F-box protein At4g10400-like [Trifolium pratense]
MMMSSSHHHRSIPTEDRVSNLPDSILSHILSFLPTKSSAATSVLSKRWETLWLSLFDLDDLDGRQSFKDFINFLPPHEATDTIIIPCINEIIIDAAFQRGGTQTLDLHKVYRPKDQLKLTRRIFTCRTLTFLKLKNLCVNDLPFLPNIPLLKTLHLENVYFTTQTHIFKLLLACPNLEELQIIHVIVLPPKNKAAFDEHLPRLARLVRATVSDDNLPIPFSLLSGVQILNVKSIWHIYIQLPTFQNLTQMEIFFANFKGRSWRDKWNWTLEMLQHTPKLQDLTIHEDMKDAICEDNWHDPQVVPECLSSQLRTLLFRDCIGRQCELQFLKYVMRNSMVLHSVTIHSANSINFNAKYQMLLKLVTFRRGSRACRLKFHR